jgi:hypothetical protein
VPWEPDRLELERKAIAGAVDSLLTLGFFRKLQASGDPVVCLLGNHDVDLLRGDFRYFPRQKAWLLALAGVEPGDIAAHARREGPGPGDWTDPDLAWLRELPFLAVGAGVLAVHGGPTHTLVRSFDILGIRDVRDLAAYLQRGRAAGFRHASLEEGASVLSPDSADDDAVLDTDLCRRFQDLANARLLAVGHSPFLHFPKGQWQDLDDPEIAACVEVPALLGAGGRVLKLDTNTKRGGPCWLVRVGMGSEGCVAFRQDGLRRDLPPPAAQFEPGGGTGGLEAPAEGVDAEALGRITRALERLGSGDGADRLRSCLETLVALGLTGLSPVETAVSLARDPASVATAALEALVSRVVERHAALSVDLERAVEEAGPDCVAFVPAFEAAVIGGRTFHLGPAVARDVTASGRSKGKPVITASWFADASGAIVRVQSFTPEGPGPEARVRCGSWPPDDAAIARVVRDCTGLDPVVGRASSGGIASRRPLRPGASPGGNGKEGSPDWRLPEGPAVTDPVILAGLREWGRRNKETLGFDAGEAGFHHVLDGAGRIVPGRFRLRTPAGVQGVILVPGGMLVPVNTAFLDPASRFVVVRVPPGGNLGSAAACRRFESAGKPAHSRDHAACLAGFLDGDPIRLHSAITPAVLGLLRAGEFDALGLGDPRDPIWRRGRFLFASPDPAIAAYFFHKACTARFRIPRARFASALMAGLVTVNLFLSDHNEPLDPAARFGATDIGLEVVAIGVEGIEWLMEFLEAS